MERTVGAHSINFLFTSIFVEFRFVPVPAPLSGPPSSMIYFNPSQRARVPAWAYGHPFKCIQGVIEIRRARSPDRAVEAAELRYERLHGVRDWRLYARRNARTVSCEIKATLLGTTVPTLVCA